MDVEAVARREFPGSRIAREGDGQLSVALRVGDDLVVRFPKHALGIERLRFEVRLLDALRPRLTTPVPDIVRVELDRPAGSAFVAHRAIPGRILRGRDIAAMAPERVSAVASRVATFLRELHALTARAHEAGVPERPLAGFAADLLAEVDELLGDRIGPVARQRAERELAALAAVQPRDDHVLCHTDIGGNVLFDEATDAIAVIDFGSCFISDPVLDVASLSVLGDDFVDACAATYPLLGELVAPARVVRDTFVLQEALYAARQADWEHADDVVRSYAETA